MRPLTKSAEKTATVGARRYVFGAALAMALAALLGDVTWEVVKLFVERARPEEVLGSQVHLSHDRTWSHIGSYPSGHMLVTTVLAATAASVVPALRWPLVAYAAVVGATALVSLGLTFQSTSWLGSSLL